MLHVSQVPRDIESLDWLPIAVYAEADPLGNDVKVGLLKAGDPDTNWLASSEWVQGQAWESEETPVIAQAKVGPGGDMVLERGVTYLVKAQFTITAGARVPVITGYQLLGI